MVGRIGALEGISRWTVKGDAENGLGALSDALGGQFKVAKSTAGSAVISSKSATELPEIPDWTVTSQPS